MPNIDSCHHQVVRALEKDGWRLERAQYNIIWGRRRIYVDGLFSRGANGTQEHLFLLEIKCFSDTQQITHDIYTSIGQYRVYRHMIDITEPELPLYLSVPSNIYDEYFDDLLRDIFDADGIKMVIVDLDTERVVTWIR